MWQFFELLTLALIPAFLLLDVVFGARKFRTPRYFRAYALACTAMTLVFSISTSLFWGRVFDGFTLLNGQGLGIFGGTAAGILVYELLHYGYHRLAHKSNLLWRFGHQMHHAPESLDGFGALFLHPVDTFFFASLSSFVFFPILGLRVEAGILGALFLNFCAMFQHANIKTPRWLGYIIQRPESHGIHHQKGVHAYNYSDLPLWDIVFGTFRNPETFSGEVGFEFGASKRIPALLMGRDISSGSSSELAELAQQAPDTDRSPPLWVGGE
jgi:sterol desaturase/sphingolipid hydroxylase (fatty acid hydroxylase superfamily)